MEDSQLSRPGGYGLTGEGAHGVDVCAVILVKINFSTVVVVNCGTNVIDAVRSRMRWVQRKGGPVTQESHYLASRSVQWCGREF